MYPNRTPLGLVLKKRRRHASARPNGVGHQQYLPFCIVLFLSLDDAVHKSGIPEQCNGQLAIKPAVDSACQDLMDEIVHDAV